MLREFERDAITVLRFAHSTYELTDPESQFWQTVSAIRDKICARRPYTTTSRSDTSENWPGGVWWATVFRRRCGITVRSLDLYFGDFGFKVSSLRARWFCRTVFSWVCYYPTQLIRLLPERPYFVRLRAPIWTAGLARTGVSRWQHCFIQFSTL